MKSVYGKRADGRTAGYSKTDLEEFARKYDPAPEHEKESIARARLFREGSDEFRYPSEIAEFFAVAGVAMPEAYFEELAAKPEFALAVLERVSCTRCTRALAKSMF